MAVRDGLVRAVQDASEYALDELSEGINSRVVESYDLPIVGLVEIRRYCLTGNYCGWVQGRKIVDSSRPEDLEITRKFVGEFAYHLAEGIVRHINEVSRSNTGLFSRLMLDVGKCSEQGKDWMQKYRS